MKTLYRSLLLSIGALALAGAAYGQVPSTNDTSTTDGKANTGMGTGALSSLAGGRGERGRSTCAGRSCNHRRHGTETR
jgi:hypothetical protein